jgi:hypothetical protein
MSFAAFQKLAFQFTLDVRKLARQELLQELKAGGMFPNEPRAMTRPGPVRISFDTSPYHTKAPVAKAAPVRKLVVAPKHVPGGGVKCRFPGCGKLSKGPRFHFFCVDHRTLSKGAREALKTAAARGNGHRKAAKTPLTPSTNRNGKDAKLVVVNGKRGIEHNGLRLTYEQWSAKLCLNRDAVRHRLRRGCTPLQALTMAKAAKRPRTSAN